MIITRVCVNKKNDFQLARTILLIKKEHQQLMIITTNLYYFLSIEVLITFVEMQLRIAYTNMHKFEMERHKLPHSVFS